MGDSTPRARSRFHFGIHMERPPSGSVDWSDVVGLVTELTRAGGSLHLFSPRAGRDLQSPCDPWRPYNPLRDPSWCHPARGRPIRCSPRVPPVVALWAAGPARADHLGKSGLLDSGGVKLHDVTAGEGPLLVLLHGFPDYHYTWRDQMPALAKHVQVVA